MFAKKDTAVTGSKRRPDIDTREGLVEAIEHIDECDDAFLKTFREKERHWYYDQDSLLPHFANDYQSKRVGARRFALRDVFVSVVNPDVCGVTSQNYVFDFEAEVMQSLFNGYDKAAGSVLPFAQVSSQFLDTVKQVAGEIIDELEKGPTPETILQEVLRFRERFLQPPSCLTRF